MSGYSGHLRGTIFIARGENEARIGFTLKSIRILYRAASSILND
ncbi:MAG TPA: hypothetical protein PK156_09590 [Polyangium sp.]|nr:hypothetical protein [Polyangium sp.]